MRTLDFNDYDKKRKASKVKILQARDRLNKHINGEQKRRNDEERILLYKLAKKNKERMFLKIGEREYQLIR